MKTLTTKLFLNGYKLNKTLKAEIRAKINSEEGLPVLVGYNYEHGELLGTVSKIHWLDNTKTNRLIIQFYNKENFYKPQFILVKDARTGKISHVCYW